MEKSFLDRAREAVEDKDYDEARTCYSLAKDEDPDNAEAVYFAAYYDLLTCKKIGTYDHFSKLCNRVPKALKLLKNYDEKSKETLLKSFFNTFCDMPVMVHNAQVDLWDEYRASQKLQQEYDAKKKSAGKMGTEALYAIGDAAAAEGFKTVAADAWKKAVELHQKWPYYKIEGDVAAYTTKIQEVDPNYVPPKKAGCISFAKA